MWIQLCVGYFIVSRALYLFLLNEQTQLNGVACCRLLMGCTDVDRGVAQESRQGGGAGTVRQMTNDNEP